jgi:hypothetical protein
LMSLPISSSILKNIPDFHLLALGKKMYRKIAPN